MTLISNNSIFKDFANNRTSILVQNQLPEFVRNNYPNFIAFVEAYYEFLEQKYGLSTFSKNIPNILDIDYVVENNISAYVELFRQQYLNSIPTTVLADKALLIKHIKDFYSSRGTPKSFKFLFRILFNEDVDIFNTSDQVLIASGGKWLQPFTIRIKTSNTLSDFVNTQIFGQSSFASAIVDTVNVNFSNGFSYNELTLNNIIGSFSPNETITSTTLSNNTLYATIIGSLSKINIVSAGHSYNVGDPVLITGNGGGSAIISQVSSGGLSALNIIQGGAGFQVSPTFAVGISGVSNLSDEPNISIVTIDTSGNVSPNNYIISNSVIVPSTNISMNAIINQTFAYTNYSNCGPIAILQITSPGSHITDNAVVSVGQVIPIGNSNINIQDYGSIGRFTVINGGLNYNIGDDVKFVNITSRGIGAGARVKTVDANGVILTVLSDLPTITGIVSISNGSNTITGTNTLFTQELLANNDSIYPGSGSVITVANQIVKVMTITNNTTMTINVASIQSLANQVVGINGSFIGGFGYKSTDFPNGLSLSVVSSTGTGANIVPYCILGQGTNILPIKDSSYGIIKKITLTNAGDSYVVEPQIDLTGYGDGTATASAVFLNGIFQYPGYFLNEDGMLSVRRYLQNSVYNNYSYILRSPVALNNYQDIVNSLLSPVGTNMIGITAIKLNPVETNISTFKYITITN